MINSAAELLKAGALRTEAITVCGLSLHIRELSVAQRKRMAQVASEAAADVGPVLVQMCVVDAKGLPLFGDDAAEQIAAMRPDIVDGIAREVLRLSGVTSPGKD